MKRRRVLTASIARLSGSEPYGSPDHRRRPSRVLVQVWVGLLLLIVTAVGLAILTRSDGARLVGHNSSRTRSPDLAVFLKPDVDDVAAESLLEDIREMEGVQLADLQTREEATAEAKRAADGHPDEDAFASLPDDAFPATIRIFLEDPGFASDVSGRVAKRSEVEHVSGP